MQHPLRYLLVAVVGLVLIAGVVAALAYYALITGAPLATVFTRTILGALLVSTIGVALDRARHRIF
jgi:hypothetical protein